VIAITVFFLLVVAFYAFFAPFLGKHIFEYASVAVYTPVVSKLFLSHDKYYCTICLAIAVFILYVRCTRINPADPGIMSKFDNEFKYQRNKKPGMPNGTLPSNHENNASGAHSSPTSACRSSLDGSSRKVSAIEDATINMSTGPQRQRSACCSIGGFMCALFVKEDCRKHEDTEEQAGGEDALFCTLCNSEVWFLDNKMWNIAIQIIQFFLFCIGYGDKYDWKLHT
ncbi:hypothetical protein GW17_00009771, partial [Ensete ventricosum]